jgi:FkbM family methyltransferase
MLNKAYRTVVDSVKGNLKYQPLFERLCQSIFLAMNCGTGGDISSSGELYVLEYLKQKFKPLPDEPIIIFDVGANIGEYTSCLLKIFTDRVEIFGFEPAAETYKILSQNINLNDRKNVKLYNLGLGDVNTTLSLFSEEKSGSTIASVYKSSLEYWKIDNQKEEVINIRQIDDFCAENNINRINFLKIDVEGHELKVLNGASKMMNLDAIDFIQFEFSHCNIASRTYFKDFFDLLSEKYKLYRIVKNGLYPIDRYKEMYEIFYVTNYLAEHK